MDTLIQIAPSWVLLSAFYVFGFSLILVSILEWIASVFRWRSTILEQVLIKVLGRKFTQNLFTHVLIGPLHYPVKPSFIEPSMFAKVVLDMILNGTQSSNHKARLNDRELDKTIDENIEKLRDISPLLHDVLQTIILQARTKALNKAEFISSVQQDLEIWFGEITDRMTRIYRQRMQMAATLIGLLVAITLNFDLLQLVDKLLQISNITELADIAQKTGQNLKVDTSVLTERFLFGWTRADIQNMNLLNKMFGLLSGGMAMAYASEFVYQLLRKQLRPDE